jgi:hypothetical protein
MVQLEQRALGERLVRQDRLVQQERQGRKDPPAQSDPPAQRALLGQLVRGE